MPEDEGARLDGRGTQPSSPRARSTLIQDTRGGRAHRGALGDVAVERREDVFPKLSATQLRRVAQYGAPRHASAGEVLYEQGASELGIHVVLGGALEIARPGIAGDELVHVLYPGEFTGEVNVLAGRRALVRARMLEEGDVLVVDPRGLRRLIQEDSEVQ